MVKSARFPRAEAGIPPASNDLDVDLVPAGLGDLGHGRVAERAEADGRLHLIPPVGGQRDALRDAADVPQRREGDQRGGAELVDRRAAAPVKVHSVQRGVEALDLQRPAPRAGQVDGLVAGRDRHGVEVLCHQLRPEREAVDGHVRLARQGQRRLDLAGHLVLGVRVGHPVADHDQHDDHEQRDQQDGRPPPAPPPAGRARRSAALRARTTAATRAAAGWDRRSPQACLRRHHGSHVLTMRIHTDHLPNPRSDGVPDAPVSSVSATR